MHFTITVTSKTQHTHPYPICHLHVTTFSLRSHSWTPNNSVRFGFVSQSRESQPQPIFRLTVETYPFSLLSFGKVSAQGIQSTPLNLAVNWRCEPASTDLRIDFKYNTEAMATAVALNNVQFLVPIDGGVTKLQAVLPPAVW